MTEKSQPLQPLQEHLAKRELELETLRITGTTEQVLQAETDVADAKAAFWGSGVAVPVNYLGTFAARGNAVETGTGSWANFAPDPDIANRQVNTLDIAGALSLAKDFDGDVDGLTSTGSSSIKEGEESFVFGARYSGTRGVSITETTGLSGSYVHGKRVNWTDGDIWMRQTGGSTYRSETDTDSYDSQLNVTGEIIKTERAGKKIQSKSQTTGAIIDVKVAKEFLATSFVKNLQTRDFTGASSEFLCTAAESELHIALAQTITSATGLTIVVAMSGALLAYNTAPARIVVDSTLLTAQFSQNNFFNVARNTAESYATATKKVGVNVTAAQIDDSYSIRQLAKTVYNVCSNNNSVIKNTVSLADSLLNQSKVPLNLTETKFDQFKAEIGLEIHEINCCLDKVELHL